MGTSEFSGTRPHAWLRGDAWDGLSSHLGRGGILLIIL